MRRTRAELSYYNSGIICAPVPLLALLRRVGAGVECERCRIGAPLRMARRRECGRLGNRVECDAACRELAGMREENIGHEIFAENLHKTH